MFLKGFKNPLKCEEKKTWKIYLPRSGSAFGFRVGSGSVQKKNDGSETLLSVHLVTPSPQQILIMHLKGEGVAPFTPPDVKQPTTYPKNGN